MKQTLILLSLLALASCTTPALAWDSQDKQSQTQGQYQKQHDRQDYRSSWDRQQDTYNRTGVDSYENGPAVRHQEEQQWQRQQQGYGGSRYGQPEPSNHADPACRGLYGC